MQVQIVRLCNLNVTYCNRETTASLARREVSDDWRVISLQSLDIPTRGSVPGPDVADLLAGPGRRLRGCRGIALASLLPAWRLGFSLLHFPNSI